jgi:4-hydroxy-tetrahydrodipicolinate reductase
MKPLRVIQVGLGPIGRRIAERALREGGFELVGAADPAPALSGRSLAEVLGAGPAVPIRASAGHAADEQRPDLALHATGSRLDSVAPELRALLGRRIHVVSTCEELAWPFRRHPELSRDLDAAARDAGVVLLGTGVNPGFVMDKLAITLLAACDRVRRVSVVRVLDAATRRGPFQHKIGAGLSVEEFERGREAGSLGHVGLAESAHMIADSLGWPAERRLSETLQPVLAPARVATEHVVVEPGRVAGLRQSCTLFAAGAERVRLEVALFLGAPDPADRVEIEGQPGLGVVVQGGVPGDAGTAAVTLSAARLAPQLAPGLRTMLDVPLAPPGRACRMAGEAPAGGGRRP